MHGVHTGHVQPVWCAVPDVRRQHVQRPDGNELHGLPGLCVERTGLIQLHLQCRLLQRFRLHNRDALPWYAGRRHQARRWRGLGATVGR